MEIYLVGGAVRDQLLGLDPKERDWVVVGGKPDEMLNSGYQQVGKDFPVFLHPTSKEEYALARTERKSGRGYTGFECHSDDVSLEDDLLRRDLTINAMAQSEDGQIIDPYGGQQDLEHRLLRHVSIAFVEDPLRVLRIARFKAKFHHFGFTIAPETQFLLLSMVKRGELNELTAERVWLETEKALATANPAVYFQTLREIGALAILFPELDRLFGMPSGIQTQPYVDRGVSSLCALASATAISDDITIRFAACCYQLGHANRTPAHWLDEQAIDLTPLNAIKNRYRLPNATFELCECVIKHHQSLLNALEFNASQIIQTLEQLDAYRRVERFEKVCQVVVALLQGLETANTDGVHLVRKARELTATIKPDTRLNGIEISRQLRQSRIECLEQALNQLKTQVQAPD